MSKSRMRVRGRSAVAARLMMGTALCGLTGLSAAYGQAGSASVETVVVTGTNIQGVAPVGEPVVSLGQKDIEDSGAVSVQQLLTNAVPQLNGFAGANQNANGYEPRLRSLGGSSSGATLVLVDGHRIDPGGRMTNVSDPNIIPTGAIERVEILADGASAIYGSDAVAGVINIITRKDYDGIQFNLQGGFASDYSTQTVGAVFGHAWDSGGVLATYNYTHRSDLPAADRAFVSGNQSNSGPGATGKGGANFNTYACSPATVVPATGQTGANLVYSSPYAAGTGITNNSTLNGLCSTVQYGDLLPDTATNSAYVSLHQSFGPDVKVTASMIFSNQAQTTQNSRGTITNVTTYGPGSAPAGGSGQINPFFQGPPGVNTETVSYDFDQLFGPGAKSLTVQQDIMGSLAADVAINDNWAATATAVVGDPKYITYGTGSVNKTAANLAINGTSSTNGSPTANLLPNALGGLTTSTQLPLTTANAFNPFSATAAGTSANVLTSLLNGQSYSVSERPIYDLTLKVDGTLFKLPAGDLKVAIGGEDYSITQRNDTTAASPLAGSTQSLVSFGDVIATARHVTSAFAEINIPVLGEAMNIPLIQKLDVDLAGRLDHYGDLASNVSTTTNPKLGLNWVPIDDLTLRAAYGTSFVAPAVGLNQLGTPNSTLSSYFANGGAAFTLPQGYANSSFLGCPATGSCTITSGSGVDGIVDGGANNPALKPQTGIEWSTGYDWTPHNFLNGFHSSATYWVALFKGVITNSTNVNTTVNTPGLGFYFIVNPTAAQISAAEANRTATSTLPTKISFISSGVVNANIYNFRASGIDFDEKYNFDTDNFGAFSIDAAGELKTHFIKQIGAGPWVNALGIQNTTNTFSPIRFAGRAQLNWNLQPLAASLSANYVGDYFDTDPQAPFAASACPAGNVTTNGLGCQHVSSYLTFDTHMAYNFSEAGFFTQGLQVYADISNLFDIKPPFVDRRIL